MGEMIEMKIYPIHSIGVKFLPGFPQPKFIPHQGGIWKDGTYEEARTKKNGPPYPHYTMIDQMHFLSFLIFLPKSFSFFHHRLSGSNQKKYKAYIYIASLICVPFALEPLERRLSRFSFI